MAANVDPAQLPEGFTLEADPTALPEGFTLESVPQFASPPSGMVHDIYTGAANLASKVPYLPQAAEAVGGAFNRVGSNIPFADRATALASSQLGSGDYNTNLAAIRAQNAQRWKEHPYQETAASIAGAGLPILGGVGKVAQAAGLGKAMLQGGVMGAGWGFGQGVSDIPDIPNTSGTDVGNVAKSTVTGAGTGLALPAIGRGVGAIYRGITNAPTRVVAGMERPAQDKLIEALNYDDPARVRQDVMALGPQANVMDVSPSAKTAGMGFAAGPATPAKTELMRNLEGRNAGVYDRTSAALDANMGAAQSPGQFYGGLDAQAKAIASGPQNTAIEARNNGVKIDTTDIRSNLGTALSNSEGNAKATRALNSVRDGLQNQVLDPQGKPIPGLVKPVDDPLVLHNVKKSFDDLIKYGDPALGIGPKELKQRGGPIMTFRGQLNEALRNAIPGYGDANDQLSSLIRQREQFDLGQSLLTSSKKEITDPRDFAQTFNALSPEEQAAQKAGTRADLNATLGVKGNNPNVRNPTGPLTDRFSGSEGWNQQNLGTQWGQQPVTNVMNTLNAEKTMRDTYNDLYKGSMTSMRESAKAANNPPQPWQVSRGLIAGPLNTALRVGNAGINAFRSGLAPDTTVRDLQMVRQGLTPQGPGAQAVIDALMGANAKRMQNTAYSQALAKALMGSGAGVAVGATRIRERAGQ